jgi:hypothetical protein
MNEHSFVWRLAAAGQKQTGLANGDESLQTLCPHSVSGYHTQDRQIEL